MGTTAADLFAQSLVDMVQGDRAKREAILQDERVRGAIAEWQQALDSANHDNAANIAEKHALRQQLARYAPNHPLLKNQQLREKLQDLGARAFAISKNFDDARKVGETYFPSDTPPFEK
jgi:hypothetical protein